MCHWALRCSICGEEIPHSSVVENLPFTYLDLPHKPQFPTEGLDLACPHCGKSAIYQRHELVESLQSI
jgi:DNA-directed RNA polymerase subunit RPC12/RpoP